jgi:diacylglycerol kinase (ATP)
MGCDVCVIVNPASGRGRGARMLPLVRETFAALGVDQVMVTQNAGDERTLSRQCLDRGCTTLVAVGGDGTWSNAANAILESRADCRLALLAAGTGNDFAKTVGAPAGDLAATARLAVEGADVRIDVGRIEDRHFLNIAGFGIDIAVLEDCATLRWPHADSLYLVSALRQLVRYPGVEIAITSPRAARERARHLMLVIANAKHFGGSFHIAPDAELADGRLDAISIHDASLLGRLDLFVSLTQGTHVANPRVVVEKAASFTLGFAEPPAYETDGEYRRARSTQLEVTCVPQALRVVTPAAAAVGRPAPVAAAAPAVAGATAGS